MYNIGAAVWPGLSKLIEEAGEVQQICGKIIALGGDGERQHWDGTDLRERLEEELADLLAAIDFVQEMNGIGISTEAVQRREDKLAKFRHWHFRQKPGAAGG